MHVAPVGTNHMAHEQKQIFLTSSPTRWQRFKWTFRIAAFIIAVVIAILAVAITREFSPKIPQIKHDNKQYKAIIDNGKNAALNNLLSKYSGFGNYISKANQLRSIKYVNRSDSQHNYITPIRAAFYDATDEQSYYSLKNNINKLNMLLPLWMTIDSAADTIIVNSEIRGLDIIKGSGIPVVAVISNFSGEDFNGKPLHRIFASKNARTRLIDGIIHTLQQNHFAGVNIDFEELAETSDEPLITFMKELYERMHPLGLTVTQDVPPLNPDFNLKELAKYNDHLFVMAYDEYNSNSAAGPISSQKYIEAAMDDAIKSVPPEKLVLAIAGYGYDWAKGKAGEDVSYAEALSIAGDEDAKVRFDTGTYNLSYSYTDDDETQHDVYFTDAATNFNTMRFATEYGVAGVALWRLGQEDSRLWTFYNKDLSDDATDTFNYNVFNHVNVTTDVNYVGEGEILDVITQPKAGQVLPTVDTEESLIANERYDSLPSIFVIRKYGKKDKKVVLTFDDGPDERYTPRILDILSREHVPAAFFVTGVNAVSNIPIIKREYREGFELGNHTFSHPNIAAVGQKRAQFELNSTRLLLESITGHSTILFRAPYNADSEPETMQELEPVAFAKDNNYLTVGESIDPNDWEKGISADSIFARVVQQANNGNIILLHDAGGDREQTIIALPRIIRYFKDRGYTFTNVADLVNEKDAQLMPAVPRNKSYYLVQFSYYMAEASYWGGKTLFYLFVACIFLSIGKLLFLACLAIKQRRKEKNRHLLPLAGDPLISIIVPAYNEEVNAVNAVNKLLKSTYPNLNIVFVDDGSSDNTYKKVLEAFKDNGRITVLTKPNGGKASALNYGIAHTSAEYVMCIDADTHLQPDAISLMVRHFTDAATGAVAGNVKVGNEVNLLTRWQNIEYVTSQNFDRYAFAAINAITVVPGAIGAFRKSAIQEAGGFTSDTFAEDCDLTMRLLRAGYTIKNENAALALTEAPETLRQFLKQRFRWSFGIIQSFWKNRDALFNKEYGSLGMIALPNILIFQVLIPLISPLADVFMIIGILTGNALMILKYYGLFMLIDIAVATMAFSFERENLLKLIWIIPQRIAYRWLMLYILYKSIRRALKGQLQNWGVLKRTGNIKENARLKTFKM